MMFWLVLKFEISYRVIINWRIFISFRGFFEDYIFACWDIWVSINLLFQLRYFQCKLVASVPSTQVLPHPQLIFPSKTWFFGIYLNFWWHKSLQHQYLRHSESKSYQINSIKSCSSKSFQQHQSHIPIRPKFSATI